MNQELDKPRAYSYVRFSSLAQQQGHSVKRQMEMSETYARAHGLELDTQTFSDLGLSAFHGRNAETGALGAFKEAVRIGAIAPGSFLLVEALDRISRQTVRKAVRTIEDICELGITVVDISDGGRRYSLESLDSDQFGFVMLVLKAIRANEESTQKQGRLLKVYANKRAIAASGQPFVKPFTRRLVPWLRWDEEHKTYAVIEERAAVVADIFARADKGEGRHRIAHSLQARGIDTWGVGRKAARWHTSYVTKILRNRAVVGTFTPHRAVKDGNGKITRVPQDGIEGYWPAVVERDVFDRVLARGLTTAARGRNAGNPPKMIFAGVIKCVHCGGTVTRLAKGDHVYLVCAKANAKAGCLYQAVPYGATEERLVTNAAAIVDEAPRGQTTDEAEVQIRAQDEAVAELADRARGLVDELSVTASEAVRRRLREVENEHKGALETLRSLREQRDTLAGPVVNNKLQRLLAALTVKPLDVTAANLALRDACERITFDPVGVEGGLGARLLLHWRHAPGDPSILPIHSRHAQGPFDVVVGGYDSRKRAGAKSKQ